MDGHDNEHGQADKVVTIYTDGACRGNQNACAPGGYGAVLDLPGGRLELAQGYKDTTNNRMELRAAIAALKALDDGHEVEIFTDSKYLCDAFNQNWIQGWISRGWKTASKKPVKNRDLWEELIPLVQKHAVSFSWVKGHAGHPGNERADALACEAADDPAGHWVDRGETVPTSAR